jgi:hypothetical protein
MERSLVFPEIFPLIRGAGFSPDRLEASEADYKVRWSLVYETLRSLCREYPRHKSERAVAAKVWIIGRSYATQIERKVVSRGGQGSSLDQVVTLIHDNWRDIDSWIADLPDGEESALSDDVVLKCVRAHGRLVHLLETITYRGQSPRSFASKYLHFHRPVVPIYDSVASQSLSKLVRWRAEFDCGPLGEPEDAAYRQFVMHFRQLNGLTVGARLNPSVRALDWYLMNEGERLRSRSPG